MTTPEELAERVKQLETENRRLVAMLDALDDHVILHGLDGRLLFLNRATEAVAQANFGLSRAEVIGRDIMEGSQAHEFKQYVRGLVAQATKGGPAAEAFLRPAPHSTLSLDTPSPPPSAPA